MKLPKDFTNIDETFVDEDSFKIRCSDLSLKCEEDKHDIRSYTDGLTLIAFYSKNPRHNGGWIRCIV